jgi:hypothetical protein
MPDKSKQTRTAQSFSSLQAASDSSGDGAVKNCDHCEVEQDAGTRTPIGSPGPEGNPGPPLFLRILTWPFRMFWNLVRRGFGGSDQRPRPRPGA